MGRIGGRAPWLLAGLLAGALVAVAVPVWGLVSTPSAVSAQLGFTQVTPCVVVDTRKAGAGGPFTAPETRDYDVTGTSSLASQGGSASGCGVPEGVAGVFFNLKTEHQSGVGRVEIYETGGTATGAPIVNFDPSSFKDNAGATSMICQESCPLGKEFTVNVPGQTGASTQVIVTVLAYFTEALERTIVVNGGGTDDDNGTALLTALDAIPTTGPDKPSATNPWLIELEPGTYDLGTVPIGANIPGNVHLRGAGADISTITCACSTAAVWLLDSAFSDISVLNTSGRAIEVLGFPGFVRIEGVHGEATGTSTSDHGLAVLGSSGELSIEDSVLRSAAGSALRIQGGDTTITSTTLDGNNNTFMTTAATLRVVSGDATVIDSVITAVEGRSVHNSGTLRLRDSRVSSARSANSSTFLNDESAALVVEGSSILGTGTFSSPVIWNAGVATIRHTHIDKAGSNILNAAVHNSGTIKMSHVSVRAPVDYRHESGGSSSCEAVVYEDFLFITTGTC